MRIRPWGACLIALFICAACADDGGNGDGALRYEAQDALPGTQVLLDLSGSFFDRPFPMDATLEADGTVDVHGFPHADSSVVEAYLDLADTRTGFSTMGGVFLRFDGLLDPASLPADGHASLGTDPSLFLVCVDVDSEDYGKRVPVTSAFKDTAETMSVDRLLVALPVLGIALRPETTYALVVTDKVTAADGSGLGAPSLVQTVKWGWQNDVDWSAAPTDVQRLVQASASLGEYLDDESLPAGVPAAPAIERIRAFTVFTTDDPTVLLRAIGSHVHQSTAGEAPTSWTVSQRYDDFCVITGTFPAPRWQFGDPPYTNEKRKHGMIELDALGRPVQQAIDELRFSLTIPKATMPADGFPMMVFAHGMGGDYMQGIHRGDDFDTSPNPTLGTGPAMTVARRGIAAGGLDAVAHGPRAAGSSQTLAPLNFFNFLNPWSAPNNVLQTVSDYMVYFRMAGAFAVDPTRCEGVDVSASADGKVHWDASQTFFMGHSLGSIIGGDVAAMDPNVRVSLLSGAGGSAVSFVLSQKTPLDIAGTIELVLGYDTAGGESLDAHDPLMTLIQMLYDPADSPNMAPLSTWRMDPGWPSRHVIQLHGIGDTYTPEFTAAAVASSFRMDIAAGETDAEMVDRASFAGGEVKDLPISGNRSLPSGEPSTAVLLSYQVPGAPQVNPHYGTFRMERVKFQYSCFLRTFLDHDVPTLLPPVDDSAAACE